MSENLQKILEIFYQICEIPHPSGQTSELKAFLIDFLRACACEVKTDSAGNIHALKGTPNVVFQAHYDMVLVGEEVAPYIQGDLLKSRNSSLGADNGIAVAMLLHFAKTRKNIEILLTNDEEIGMLGAKNLALQTRSKAMINLDSECINEICVGCAGGFDVDIDLGNLPFGNSPLGLHSADFANLGRFADFSPVSHPKFAKNHESQTENLSVVDSAQGAESSENFPSLAEGARGWVKTPSLRADSQNLRGNPPYKKMQNLQSGLPRSPTLARNDDSFLDSAESQNLVKNNSVRSTQTRPLRGAKNRNQGHSSASADFLLEAEKRGSPSKSEKRSFWRVEGAGREVQPFCEKEKSSNESAESKRDSSPTAQNDKIMDCNADSANLLAMTDFNGLPRASAQNGNIINIGIIGRVNVGKSSILNALLGKERSLVSEIEGTTIDPVSDEITHGGQILRFVDTAGIRRASKIEGIEKFALSRTKRILEQSNIVLLVLDSSRDFVELDEKISGLSQKYNLGVIILLNKWDIKCADFSALQATIKRKFAYLSYAPILTISALKMRHIDEIKDTILRVWENFNRRIPTAKLNEHIKIATARHPLPSERGKIVKIYYASQVDCAPPQILLVMNRPRALHFSYKRYLVNYFRANFDFSGVPLVILSKGRGKDEIAE